MQASLTLHNAMCTVRQNARHHPHYVSNPLKFIVNLNFWHNHQLYQYWCDYSKVSLLLVLWFSFIKYSNLVYLFYSPFDFFFSPYLYSSAIPVPSSRLFNFVSSPSCLPYMFPRPQPKLSQGITLRFTGAKKHSSVLL